MRRPGELQPQALGRCSCCHRWCSGISRFHRTVPLGQIFISFYIIITLPARPSFGFLELHPQRSRQLWQKMWQEEELWLAGGWLNQPSCMIPSCQMTWASGGSITRLWTTLTTYALSSWRQGYGNTNQVFNEHCCGFKMNFYVLKHNPSISST